MPNNKPQNITETSTVLDGINMRANFFGVFNPSDTDAGAPKSDMPYYDAHIKAREAFRTDLDVTMDAINHTRANMFEWRMPGIYHAPDISNQKIETDADDNPDVVGLSMAA